MTESGLNCAEKPISSISDAEWQETSSSLLQYCPIRLTYYIFHYLRE